MPWRATSIMDQRTQLIADHLRHTLSITELCALYDISRKKGYKWIDRYLRHGPAGLEYPDRFEVRYVNGWPSSSPGRPALPAPRPPRSAASVPPACHR